MARTTGLVPEVEPSPPTGRALLVVFAAVYDSVTLQTFVTTCEVSTRARSAPKSK